MSEPKMRAVPAPKESPKSIRVERVASGLEYRLIEVGGPKEVVIHESTKPIILSLAVIWKLALAPLEAVSWQLALLVFLGLLNFAMKRYLVFRQRELTASDQARLKSLEDRVANLEADSAMRDAFR